MTKTYHPPFTLTHLILKLSEKISREIGRLEGSKMIFPSITLRRSNQIKTVHASLAIEGNTLTIEQISDLLNDKRVLGPKKDILEVVNANLVYDNITDFEYSSAKSFLKAHEMLMQGIVEGAGKFRSQGVGIFQGSKVAHIAPPAENVPHLMNELFKYLKNKDELLLIKSCVFHYEMEFIHPFIDGNGRMGRLWQTVILMQEFPVFEFLPFETLISQSQQEYYKSLAKSDRAGKSTEFIEYMLYVIDKSLEELLNYNNRILTDRDRIDYFISLGINEFSRKDYMNVFKDISTATASRDLKKATELNLFEKIGEKNQVKYKTKLQDTIRAKNYRG